MLSYVVVYISRFHNCACKLTAHLNVNMHHLKSFNRTLRFEHYKYIHM